MSNEHEKNPNYKPEGEPYMTLDEAEQILAAYEVGAFKGDRSDLAHARLLWGAHGKEEKGGEG